MDRGASLPKQAADPTPPPATPEPETQRIRPVLSDDDPEPYRIAGELCAAVRMGYLDGPNDPEARFLAKAIQLFRGRIAEY
jgi:hypothetical protein